jgi:protease I
MTTKKSDKPSARVLFILPPEGFRDEELLEPRSVLEAAGIAVDLASTRTGILKGDVGALVRVEKTLDQVWLDEYDFVAVVGGSGTPKHLWDADELHELVRRAAARTQGGIGGICAGSVVLARAGLLKGLPATTYPVDAFITALREAGAEYRAEPVVRSGRIITSDGPQGARAFGDAIAAALR